MHIWIQDNPLSYPSLASPTTRRCCKRQRPLERTQVAHSNKVLFLVAIHTGSLEISTRLGPGEAVPVTQ